MNNPLEIGASMKILVSPVTGYYRVLYFPATNHWYEFYLDVDGNWVLQGEDDGEFPGFSEGM